MRIAYRNFVFTIYPPQKLVALFLKVSGPPPLHIVADLAALRAGMILARRAVAKMERKKNEQAKIHREHRGSGGTGDIGDDWVERVRRGRRTRAAESYNGWRFLARNIPNNRNREGLSNVDSQLHSGFRRDRLYQASFPRHRNHADSLLPLEDGGLGRSNDFRYSRTFSMTMEVA